MPALPSDLRNKLERVITDAREVAEVGARAALEALAVHHHEPYSHQKADQRALRTQLRARARQLGDQQNPKGELAIGHLVHECAYEHWHRMIFARFLAENNLLIEPESNMAISLAEAEELAKGEAVSGWVGDEKRQDAASTWVYASRCAQRMLPQIFRPADPLLQVSFATEHMLKLERLLTSLPTAVFTASDALGWVYQFWQSKKKDEINQSGVKIGADEISAVTQLFTEPYMVEFLLHNTLGAWWSGKVAAASSRWSSCTTEQECRDLCALPGLSWDYLRFIEPAPIGFYRKGEPVEKTAANLPHWYQDGATYFVTFRTADSLPQERLQQRLAEKEQWDAAHPEPRDDKTMEDYYRRFPERIEHWLDQGYGACHLGQPAVGGIVEGALRHFDGERYSLGEFVVAGNHVHVLVTPKAGHELPDILHSWKSFTANLINKQLGRSGAFWQKESFDHIVRCPGQLERIRGYIRGHGEKRHDAASTLRAAGGTFGGWPATAAELKILDPCCGSGHFLVAALHHLVPIRMAEEGLTAAAAVDAVLRDNIFGLEIDERCCQIAAFALALEAWKISGWKPLPPLNIACTGVGPQCSAEQWIRLAEESGVPMPTFGREAIKDGLLNLHELFSRASTLGSLINPAELPGNLIAADFETIQPYLEAILEAEKPDDAVRERAIAAAGMVKAAELLAGEFTLVITNVPYLGRGKQDDLLKAHLEKHFDEGKGDLATAFALRCVEFCSHGGGVALVVPWGWTFATTYQPFRERILKSLQLNILAKLGEGGFASAAAAGAFVVAPILTRNRPPETQLFAAVDASRAQILEEKSGLLTSGHIVLLSQMRQFDNPDSRILFGISVDMELLSERARSYQGIKTGDDGRGKRNWWEFPRKEAGWRWFQSTVDRTSEYGGCEHVLRWENGGAGVARLQGQAAWGKPGVAVSLMRALRSSIYSGEVFDSNVAAVVLEDAKLVGPLWAYCSSQDFDRDVRRIDPRINAMTGSLVKISFNLEHWKKIVVKQYPGGLPEPESDDLTQWLFHGFPGGRVDAGEFDKRQDAASTSALQVAVARLMGYRWPAELDEKMRLSARARGLVKRCNALLKFADDDGIVCIPAVRGEEPAAERLRKLLEACGGSGILPLQSAAQGQSHVDLDDWLRNDFFEQHCKMFHDRPFVWHIWDGRKRDGFHALVNYHKLADGKQGRMLLEKLTYTYLGEWISRQHDGVKRGEGGAEDRLAAAVELQKRLEAILAGEPPHDIFVRWKPLQQQAIGWEPDINDGVRLNIRPFMAADLPNGKKGAGVLRWKANIKWEKDRGREPERKKAEYPWFWGWDGKAVDFMGGKEFKGERFNDCHYTVAAKRKVREDHPR